METLARDADTDGGHRRPRERADPQRRCVVTGIVKGKDDLLRFVVDPEQRVVPDVEQRLPGRGIWLSADRETLKKACSKKMFAKAARAGVIVPSDLVDQVECRLIRHCLNLIGMARRAGQAVFGYEKARDWLRSGRGGLLLVAADASVHAQAKARALCGGESAVVPLTADELGTVVGGRRAVHVVVAPGPLAERLRGEMVRLAGIRRIAADDLVTDKSLRTSARVSSQT